MKKKVTRIASLLLSLALLSGCSTTETTEKHRKKVKKETTETEEPEKTEKTDEDYSDPTDDPSTGTTFSTTPPPAGIVDFSMFIAMAGAEIDSGNNAIQEEIANLTGVRVNEVYLTGQTPAEAISSIISSGDFPDFIYAGDYCDELYINGCLLPWDDYLADPAYSNLRDMYSDKEWEMFRQDDGHIYWADVFGTRYGKDTTMIHSESAFWIQVRVLEWAGYPKIETLEQYFDLLESYYAANKTNEDGTEIIPYTCLTEDWRYFCIEHAPALLDGYYDDGYTCVNDTDFSDPTVVLYDTPDTAKKYFSVLNKAYNKGLVDPDFAVQSYDQYISKLTTGAVLGMFDQWWDFAYVVNDSFESWGYDELGYNYVPLGLTIEEGMTNHYHAYTKTINAIIGTAVTTACKYPDLAFQFMNQCLDQDIMNLRFWGIEGEDYEVDNQGMFYRTPEMRSKWQDYSYRYDHICTYDYLPQYYSGTSKDGINAMKPAYQKSEFFADLAEPLVKCFEAYGYSSYVDFLCSEEVEVPQWYPMYTFVNNMSSYTAGGQAFVKISETKHEWLPKLVMASSFDATWKDYVDAYNSCNPQPFIDEVQQELDYRMK